MEIEYVYSDENVRLFIVDLDMFDKRYNSMEGPYQPTAIKTNFSQYYKGEPGIPKSALKRPA